MAFFAGNVDGIQAGSVGYITFAQLESWTTLQIGRQGAQMQFPTIQSLVFRFSAHNLQEVTVWPLCLP